MKRLLILLTAALSSALSAQTNFASDVPAPGGEASLHGTRPAPEEVRDAQDPTATPWQGSEGRERQEEQDPMSYGASTKPDDMRSEDDQN